MGAGPTRVPEAAEGTKARDRHLVGLLGQCCGHSGGCSGGEDVKPERDSSPSFNLGM